MNQFHLPVMAAQCVQFLAPRPGGVYVDATVGGGGHSLALLKAEPQIRLFAFDQDEEAIAQAAEKLDAYRDRVDIIKSNFSRLRTELALRRIKSIDGIIFDLGVSSHQLDNAARGFSFDQEAELDMRMDRSQSLTAAMVVNTLPQAELARIFKEYGEEQNAARIARAIVAARKKKPLRTTMELARLIEAVAGKGSRDSLKTKVRIFQSLRIQVNRELEVLEPTLKDAINLLTTGGRIVVLSYHSLEDRIVKNTLRAAASGCNCPPNVLTCVCGRTKRLKLLSKRAIVASVGEVEENNRSRSARLRAAEKIKGES